MINLDFSDVINNNTNLLDQAQKLLFKKLSSDPENIDYLWKLGNILRQKGHLKESLNYYEKIFNIQPNYKNVKYLILLLSEKPFESPFIKEIHPTPFVYIENFLSDSEQEQIWNLVNINQTQFKHSQLGDENTDTEYRKSHVLSQKELKPITSWFSEKLDTILPSIFERLQMEPFNVNQKEIQLTVHKNKAFYKVHTDSADEDYYKNRHLTFVYYFHKLPKLFEGGEILLFDTDTINNSYTTQHTKITPSNNSIIFFPSNYYHQVTPVHLKSNKLKNGRFTINGWVHKN